MRKKFSPWLAAMLCAFLLLSAACTAAPPPFSMTASPSPLPEDAHTRAETFSASVTPLTVFSQAVETGQRYTAAVSGEQLLWQGGIPPVYLKFWDASFDVEKAILTVLLYNQDSTGMLTYGQHYNLQYRENERQPWERIECFPFSVAGAEDIAYGLSPGGVTAVDFWLAEIPMPAGQYRFQVPVDFGAAKEQWLLGLEFDLLTNEWKPPAAGEELTATAWSDSGQNHSAAVSGTHLSWKNGDAPAVYLAVAETKFLTLLIHNHDTLFGEPCSLVPTGPCQLFVRADQRWQRVFPFTAENDSPNFDTVFPGISAVCLAPGGIRLEPGVYCIQGEFITDTISRSKTTWRLRTEFEVS